MTSNPDQNKAVSDELRAQAAALRELGTLIKKHIADMPQADIAHWLEGLRAAYGRVVAHVENLFAGQETGGYMKNVLDIRPTLATNVARLRHEHEQLRRMLHAIADEVNSITHEDFLLAGDICARMQRFMAVLQQHEQRENMIMLLVFNEDLGAGD